MVFKSFFSKSNNSYNAVTSSSEAVPDSLSDSDDPVTDLTKDHSYKPPSAIPKSTSYSVAGDAVSDNNPPISDTYTPKTESVSVKSKDISSLNSSANTAALNALKQDTNTGPKSDSVQVSTSQLLYYNKCALNVGQVMRFKMTYTPPSGTPFEPSLFLKIKNLEVVPLRAAYFAGPFILYVDVTPDYYDQNKKTYSQADRPLYEPQLKAGQSFYVPLYLNHQEKELNLVSQESSNDSESGSQKGSNGAGHPASQSTRTSASYSWTVDVVSQIIFSTTAQVQFEISIGRDQEILKNIPSSINKIFGPIGGLLVSKYDTLDLWHSPVPKPDPQNINPVHLVIVTHGLHSNVGADMLYLKETIDAAARKTGENIIVRGFFGNVRKTEKGIRYLGRRLAEYVVKEATSNALPENTKVKKISFIAHSLGGLVQTYALAHITTHYPEFFLDVKPVNFIALASPFLGISNENPYYVKFALDIGFVGKSGQDLSLMKPASSGKKPMLQILPTGPSHAVLKLFERRTIYANAVNDGIVPLRTSAILYLDWRGLSEVQMALQDESKSTGKNEELIKKISENAPTVKNSENNAKVSEIPDFKSDAATELSNANDHNDGLLSSLSNAASTPVQGFLSLFAPSAQKKDPDNDTLPKSSAVYKYSQTLPVSAEDYPNDRSKTSSHKQSHSKNSAAKTSSDLDKNKNPFTSGDLYAKHQDTSISNTPAQQQKFSVPKKTSVFESGVSVILPPLPPDSFILDPASRPITILHDRYYNDYDMPPKRFTNRPSASNGNSNKRDQADDKDYVDDERSRLEEKIARCWHKELTWRKVLVRLEPDAHNNIIVRRRFANAYGWPVIDHLVEEHFIKPSMGMYNATKTGDIGKQTDQNDIGKLARNLNIADVGMLSVYNLPYNIDPLKVLKNIPKSTGTINRFLIFLTTWKLQIFETLWSRN